MDVIRLDDKEFVKFIPHGKILSAVEKLARQVEKDTSDVPVFVVVLKGGMIFASDFAKAYKKPAIFDFIRVKSYRDTRSTGEVKVLLDISEDIRGKEVYVLEDIVDTGNTLGKIIEMLEKHQPAFVKIVTLFFKPEAYKKDHPVHFTGMEIPNKFIVGYGLDYNELGRNLQDIYQLKTDESEA